MIQLPRILRRSSLAPATLPLGLRVYAVGDIHGRDDLLQQMEDLIAVDQGRRPKIDEAIVVFLGDYIDRGPSSREVIERLAKGRFASLPICALLGNHEEGMARFLIDPVAGAAWLDWGGRETLASYGLDARDRGGSMPPPLEAYLFHPGEIVFRNRRGRRFQQSIASPDNSYNPSATPCRDHPRG